MRIAHVASFSPMEGGLASYTAYLEHALGGHDVENLVVAPHGALGDNVHACWQAGAGDFAPTAYQTLTQRTPDLVHIQHEFDLYGPQRGMEIVDLALRLKLTDVPLVVTLHDVYENMSRSDRFVLGHLVADADRLIVHEDFQLETLCRELGEAIADKTVVIDHGVREVTPVHDAKRKLDLDPAAKVVLLCGYFRPSKGFHKSLDFFSEVAEAHPDAVLVLAGKSRSLDHDDYRSDLIARIEASPLASRVQFLCGQFPQPTFDTLLSSADVVVLPYDEGAQSGVLSQAIAFRRPIVTSQLRAFASVTRRSGAGVSCPEDRYGAEISRVLGSKAVANAFSAAADTYVRRRAGWSVVARKHRDVYRSVLDDAAGHGRFVQVAAGVAPGDPIERRPDAGTRQRPHFSARTPSEPSIADWLRTAKNFDPEPARPAPVVQ